MNIATDFSLKTIIDKINKGQILLPDFQRAFVWKDEERQKSLISSVLARMPIGSILLLQGDSDEFAVRMIGMDKTYSIPSESRTKIDFLLDGQQRVTVLACAFSDAIGQNERKAANGEVEGKVPQSLQKRYFLKFPHYKDLTENSVFYGAKKLCFPYELDRYENYPLFTAEEIKEQIVPQKYSRTGQNSKMPFNPHYKSKIEGLDAKDLIDWCTTQHEGFLVPLFLLCEGGTTLNRIIQTIGTDYAKSICILFESKENEEEKDQFAVEFLPPDQYAEYRAGISNGKLSPDAFQEIINIMATQWSNSLFSYLSSCTTNISKIMSIIEVNDSERERAIDIYENLNRGGVTLSIFDLVTAKASLHPQNKEFVNRITQTINKPLTEDEEATLYSYLSTRLHYVSPINKTYMKSCGCLTGSGDGDLSSKFVDVFLNILSLYSNAFCKANDQTQDSDVPFGQGIIDLDEISIDNTKRKAKLDLNADQIYSNFEAACRGIDRALFFLKHRCGIRHINDIPYNHVLSILSFIFISDTYFKNKKINDILEAWYWTVMFSGEFDKDQNTQFINHLRNLLKKLPEYSTNDLCYWISGLSTKVFAKEGFSDEAMLVMSDDSPAVPKSSIQNAILQYYLSKYYKNFSMRDQDSPYEVEISAYIENDTVEKKYKLEIHHIIPLASMADFTDSKLRTVNSFYGNSPLNKLYIVSEDNGAISDDDISIYLQRITDLELRRKLNLFVGDYAEAIEEIDEALKYDPSLRRSKDNVLKLYRIRFEALRKAVNTEISALLKLPAPTP